MTEGEDSPGCCSKCQKLGEPLGVQKLVLRFANKYYGALLLNKRLFSPEEDQERFIAELDQSGYGN